MLRRSFSSPSSPAETMKMEARALIGSEPLLSMLPFPKLYLVFRSGMIGFNYSEEGRFKSQSSKRQSSRASVTSGSSSMGPGHLSAALSTHHRHLKHTSRSHGLRRQQLSSGFRSIDRTQSCYSVQLKSWRHLPFGHRILSGPGVPRGELRPLQESILELVLALHAHPKALSSQKQAHAGVRPSCLWVGQGRRPHSLHPLRENVYGHW